MTFKNKLILSLFLLGVVPALAISIVSSYFSQDALLKRSFDALETANALKVNLVEDYLSSLQSSVVLQASNPAIISSAKLLIEAFNSTAASDDGNVSVRASQFYDKQFYSSWVDNRPEKKPSDVQGILRRVDERGLFFQDRYIFKNPNPVGQKNYMLSDNLDDAYSKAHSSVHPYLSNVLESFSFYDIFIIDLQGNIVYSVFKEVDYATSLESGPFSSSGLATTYQKALKMSSGEVFISDYELYTPSYDKPAGFLASPLYSDGKLIGVFAAQFPIDTLNKKMSNRNGLGDTGDSFLVGKDQLLRSDSIISPEAKSVNLSFNKPESNKIQMQSVLKALDGNKGTLIEKDADGDSILVSYSPISFANLGWVIISEIKSDEALSAINKLKTITYSSIALLLLVCIAVITYLLKLVLVPLGAEPGVLKSTVDAIADGNFDYEIPHANSGSVMHSMLLMQNKLKVSAEQEKLALEKNEQIAKEKTEQAEREAARAEELMQIMQALDVTSTNVMIANVSRDIIYMNKAMASSLARAEDALRTYLPNFAADKVIGSSIDLFHKQPKKQEHLLQELNTAHVTNIAVADMHFRLTVNPIFNESHQRIGTVVEWLDRTLEVHAEEEVSAVVSAALEGRFDLKVQEDDKDGFMAFLAKGLNQLTETTSASLDDINRVLRSISRGDLTERVVKNYQGSFEELKDGCNETAENLTQMLSEIREAVETINTASSEISQGNTDLSSRTEQQASSLEETASSMEELASTVRQNADNARQANTLAAKASDVAVEGGSLIEQVVKTMASINESAQKISDIIGVIDGIAFQTNILALNAAVEAARAGEQGRGFAVVASEVRTLAQRSANAAKDIKALISDSVNKINNGNELVGKSGNTMKEIVTSIKRVNDIMAEIAAASSEQSAGLDEVGKAVTQMDEMTQQNAALVEEAAAAAESLMSQSEQLAANVARFRLDDEPVQPVRKALAAPKRQVRAAASPAVKSKAKPATKLLKPTKSDEDEWESF